MTTSITREQIVHAADDLFYRRGFEHTSFTDIARAVEISKGNIYYHFKTMAEVLRAVIEARLQSKRDMLRRWEAEEPTARGRIERYIDIVTVNGPDIERYGCPVGTLTTELAKLAHPCRDEAVEILTLFRTWLRDQFVRLGQADDADELAMRVLSASQGIATLSNAYQDRAFVQREVADLRAWLRTLETVAHE
ncbi:TetR/AcrR family transcriptional regulator [Glycomyces xiaoerkulensis]|uniref:TetR/AcrR family transcriptional regulator n=1 Tax=Glycomyces xiaoerkulensis TaxID=2038139 RepID=UPI000C2628E1|nr:TetR/AcrR family transcriptional regulator [Glycomyces xiaoerkulensis]